ncbi:MAG: ATP-binding cassette domain-containing protein [Holosporaceae bacterium]|jgi:putative ABC transport system ATP-binding protein|nr:ATP-binding cassette domain-containing protein [Holosporaceae bacterium]
MLSLNNVTKSFSGVFEPVLKGINLSLKEGEFCTVVGANGSGKSTLLKIISGEYFADSGEIRRNGEVAQVVQDVNKGTIPAMTMLENIALSRMKTPRFAFYRRHATEAIANVRSLNIGLEKFIDQPLGILSGGQRQTVATLMALISGRKILLLDEHTSALDPKMQKELMEYTARSVRELQVTTLMITHNLEDAVKYGDRLIMMHKGRIVADIGGKEKSELKIQSLLEMFHRFENQSLMHEGGEKCPLT